MRSARDSIQVAFYNGIGMLTRPSKCQVRGRMLSILFRNTLILDSKRPLIVLKPLKQDRAAMSPNVGTSYGYGGQYRGYEPNPSCSFDPNFAQLPKWEVVQGSHASSYCSQSIVAVERNVARALARAVQSSLICPHLAWLQLLKEGQHE